MSICRQPKRLGELLPAVVAELILRQRRPMRVYRLTLPWTSPPLSLNHRLNRYDYARQVRNVRETTAWLAKAALRQGRLARLDRIRVELHYQPRDNRERDDDNPVATLKACVDGLVDAGVVAGDGRKWVRREMPIIHDATPGQPGRLWLEIRERRRESDSERSPSPSTRGTR